MSVEPSVFDLGGPLPEPGRTTLLEASAGTGKTYTIAGLVTRYLACGEVEVDQLLVVTFGRAASQELRARVRGRLVASERLLADALDALDDPDEQAVAPPGSLDVVEAWLLDADRAERVARLDRLRAALAGFDAATIATTHQFCQLVLRSLGVAGDTEPDATLVDTLDDLVLEVVDDVYLRFFGSRPEPPPFDLGAARRLARAVVRDGLADLAAAGAAEQDDAVAPGAVRVAFAQEVRAEVERRKRRQGLLAYDDLLARVAQALEDPHADARARLRERWRVVLVDEFQDTDPTQWDVLERAFVGHATVVLIGDPKQAIYGFRGGDVHAYLRAAATADVRSTLATGYRADEPLARALGVLLDGAALGDERIVVHPVAPHHRGSRLAGAPVAAPLRLRRLPRAGRPMSKGGLVLAGAAREVVAADCADDIVRLLGSGATWDGRPLAAGDVAVIVHVRSHGLLVQAALQERGVPAVVAGGGHLLATESADAWWTLLQALEQPHRLARVRAAALGPFLRHPPAEVALDRAPGGGSLVDEVGDRLRGWAEVLRWRGVAALVEALEAAGLTAALLTRPGGERLLTDLRHLGQLLHDVAVRERLGLPGLLQWLRDERLRLEGTDRPRRLDSDAAAVQIVTVHASKGLEYPVVHLPFAHQLYRHPVDVARFHASDRRTLDVRGAGPGWSEHEALHLAEEAAEDLRTLYVALTRAQSQLVVWWAPTTNTGIAPLHRLMMGRRPGVAAVPEKVPVRADDHAADVLAQLERLGALSAEVVEAPTAPAESGSLGSLATTGATGRAEPLTARRLAREVDATWTRTSYSALIRVEEQTGGAPAAASEPDVTLRDDEETPTAEAQAAEAQTAEPGAAAQDGPTAADGAGADAHPVPLAAAPAGAAFGSLVHAVLEHADPAAPETDGDLVAELRRQVLDQARWWPVEVDAEALALGLEAVHRTPLGPLVPGLTLADVPLSDRLRELDFEIPLAGGDRPARRRPEIRLRDLAPVLRAHLPADDPLRPYAERLETPPLGEQPLRGYLSGSIDVVLRVPDATHGHRYVVVDYKTNRLTPPETEPSLAHYGPDALAEAMLHSHYPLQALLYAVVVHRYLRWRQPGYRPEAHLGGVAYLYLRGMAGADVPLVGDHPPGVFSWRPPAALIVALSDLLEEGTP
ncbi:UvrD-helicase domain-containing protein [Nocardioides sp. TRM66260-LWL]|uniref:UvrD-helicase domain-containing protein n=1 Tax=Nocardioides sp. TRM66260-LWL TaxID=2874478 RepID=UPI001CC7208B|nr:UvrD-helicase domain-containing protein [Nocardioides sp. TRM66260-LWL]MBZ5735769.1 UvrD-helicase domain-containing protein [Nocardioides sp. TRM66260-LWL]